MDYRNADGSIAQMCGNGVRVFAHYLRASGLEQPRRVRGRVAGRAAAGRAAHVRRHRPPTSPSRWARPTSSAPVRRPSAAGGSPAWPSTSATRTWRAWTPALTVGDAGRPRRRGAGAVRPRAVPRGRQRRGADRRRRTGRCRMRVHERGVGETRRAAREPSRPPSPRCATSARHRRAARCASPAARSRSTVTDATSYLRGPSVLVARGEIADDWWRAQRSVKFGCTSRDPA